MVPSISRREFLKYGTATLATLATPAILAGCGSSPEPTSPPAAPTSAPAPTSPPAPDEVTFSLWSRYFWEPVGPVFEGFVSQFHEKYPGITLENNVMGDSDYQSTIRVAMASDDPPDLFYAYGGNWLKFFVEEGLVADVTPYWEQYGWKDRLNERALHGVKYGDKYYAVPTEITTAGIYYNKSIFEEAGIEPSEVPTWDEFLGYCEKIKAAGYQAMCLGNKDGGKAQWWWDYAVVRENGNDYRRQVVRGEIPLNDKGIIAALERTQADIFTNGNMNDDVNGLDIFGWLGMMAEGQTGMTLIHSFLPPQLIEAMMAEPYELGFFVYPQVHESIPIANDLYVEGNQAMSARNPYPDEGAKWLDFIISEEVQAEWAATSFIPTVEAVQDKLPALTREVYDTVDQYDSFAHLDLVFHPEIVSEIYANYQSVLGGDMTPQEAMDAVQALAETLPWVGVPQGEA